MSYILFSQTSAANGQRNLWEGGGTTGAAVPAVINGVASTTPLSNFDVVPTNVEGATASSFDLGFLSAPATYPASALAAALADGKVFTGDGFFNPTLSADTGYSAAARSLKVELTDAQWNAIKNVEMRIDNAEALATESIFVRNIVDVRILVGELVDIGQPNPIPPESVLANRLEITVENAKRGEVRAYGSERAIELTLTLSTNNADWQNSFFIEGSQGDDIITILPGNHVGGTAQFKKPFVNDGSLSLISILTDGGNDLVDASAVKAATIVRLGEDSGNYFIGYEAFDIGFSAPFTSAADQLAEWLTDAAAAGLTGFTITGTFAKGSAAFETSYTIASPADIPALTDFTLGATGPEAMFTAVTDFSAATQAVFPAGTVGLGISNPNANELFGIAKTSALSNQNWEINGDYTLPDGSKGSDVLSIAWDQSIDAIGATITVAVTYTEEGLPGDPPEQVFMAFYNDDLLVFQGFFDLQQNTGTFNPFNPGIGTICVNLRDGEGNRIFFDRIDFIGKENGRTTSDANDFLLHGIRLVLPGEPGGLGISCGGDIYYASQGQDLIFYEYSSKQRDGADIYFGLEINLGAGPAKDILTIEGDGNFSGILADDLIISDATDGMTTGATIQFVDELEGQNIIYIAGYSAAQISANLAFAGTNWILS